MLMGTYSAGHAMRVCVGVAIHALDKEMLDKVEANSFMMNIMTGAGVRVKVARQISLECGVNYEYGFSDRFKCRGLLLSETTTAADAPVTYTVAEGRKVQSFTNYTTKDRLASLRLHIGIAYHF